MAGKGKLFRAWDVSWAVWLTEEPDVVTSDREKAAVIDSESTWGAFLEENAEDCGIELHWLPEDQQLRHLGAAELPLSFID